MPWEKAQDENKHGKPITNLYPTTTFERNASNQAMLSLTQLFIFNIFLRWMYFSKSWVCNELMIQWDDSKFSSCNCGSTSWIIFVWPTLLNSTGLDWPLDLEPFCAFLIQLWTIFSKHVYIYLKSEIYTKQKLHFQPVQLCCAYSSHFGIISVVEESAKWCKMFIS